MSNIQFTHYALIQVGHAIYGVGETEDDARDDARQWLDDADDADLDEPVRTDGSICCVPCSQALYLHVKEFGTCTFEQSSAGVFLPSEE
jgi:hypothetical protein